MQAFVCSRYGSPGVLKIADVEKPRPKAQEILVRIRASSVNSADCRIRKADPFVVRLVFGFTKPRKNILGCIFAGEIEEVGEKVTAYKVGDKVFGSSGMNFGAYADYISLSENATIALMPRNASFEQAAALPFGGMTALDFLRRAKIQPWQKILVYGASGSVGTSAVQIAKYFGAQVTAVCSGSNEDMIRSLGADRVIDYTQRDVSLSQEQFDIIFDAVGKVPYERLLPLLRANGHIVLCNVNLSSMPAAYLKTRSQNKNLIAGPAAEKKEDVIFLKELMEAGRIQAVIDRTYSFEQIPEAHLYVDLGHKKGNVLINQAL